MVTLSGGTQWVQNIITHCLTVRTSAESLDLLYYEEPIGTFMTSYLTSGIVGWCSVSFVINLPFFNEQPNNACVTFSSA